MSNRNPHSWIRTAVLRVPSVNTSEFGPLGDHTSASGRSDDRHLESLSSPQPQTLVPSSTAEYSTIRPNLRPATWETPSNPFNSGCCTSHFSATGGRRGALPSHQPVERRMLESEIYGARILLLLCLKLYITVPIFCRFSSRKRGKVP